MKMLMSFYIIIFIIILSILIILMNELMKNNKKQELQESETLNKLISCMSSESSQQSGVQHYLCINFVK